MINTAKEYQSNHVVQVLKQNIVIETLIHSGV